MTSREWRKLQTRFRAHARALGSIDKVVYVLQQYPEFETISRGTVWNWMNNKQRKWKPGPIERAVVLLDRRPLKQPRTISAPRKELAALQAELVVIKKQLSAVAIKLKRMLNLIR